MDHARRLSYQNLASTSVGSGNLVFDSQACAHTDSHRSFANQAMASTHLRKSELAQILSYLGMPPRGTKSDIVSDIRKVPVQWKA